MAKKSADDGAANAAETQGAAGTAPAAPTAKAAIAYPFDGLKEGASYTYARSQWPADQGGKLQVGKTYKAAVRAFPRVNEKGQIVNELRVQLEGRGRYYTLKELPQDATFTES